MRGGIYWIKNLANGKAYIGSTKNFKIRKRQHFGSLSGNRHYNKHLQNAWNKYGEDSFVFEVLKEVEEGEELIEEEQSYMDIFEVFNREKGYNINTLAHWSPGTKRKIGWREAISGENNHGSKLTWLDVGEIRNLFQTTNLSVYDLATKYKIDQSSISRILSNDYWHDEDYIYSKRCKTGIRRNTKLTIKLVGEIRNLYSTAGYSWKLLAEKFNVSETTIGDVIKNRTWYDENYFPISTNTKVSLEEVGQIRKLYGGGGVSLRAMAKKFNLSPSSICDIIKFRTWKEEK